MKKFTLLFITILAVGFLGSAQVRGQYVLDDNGYKLIEADRQGQVTTRQVENKDVPWYIRFNPSSTLAGIRDNRTSLLRRFKKAAVAGLSSAALLASYKGYKGYKGYKVYNMGKKYAEPETKITGFLDSPESRAANKITRFLDSAEWQATVSAMLAHVGLVDISKQGFSLFGVLSHVVGSLFTNLNLAEVFSKSMVKRTEHLDRNLQLNVVEAAF